MKESNLEYKVKRWCNANEFICLKMCPKDNIGIPDRLIIKDGKYLWAELKTCSSLTHNQKLYHAHLEKHGCNTCVVYSLKDLQYYLKQNDMYKNT